MNSVLQLKQIFDESWVFCRENWLSLFKAIFLGGVFFLCINAWMIKFNAEMFAAIPEDVSVSSILLDALLYSLLMTVASVHIMVVIHRKTLLGEESGVPTWGGWPLSKPNLKFMLKGAFVLLFMFAIMLILTIVGALLANIFDIPFKHLLETYPVVNFAFSMCAAILIGVVVSRVYLVFPNAALNGNLGLSISSELTSNYKVVIFVVTLGITLVTGFFSGIILDSLESESIAVQAVIESLLPILLAPFFVLQIVMLSNVYKLCVQANEDIIQHMQIKTGLENVIIETISRD